jgi:formate hydrogenlyase subunit 4
MLSALVLGVVLPFSGGNPWLNLALALGGMFGLAIVIGVVESVMARLRLPVVPQLLIGAGAVATVALILTLR